MKDKISVLFTEEQIAERVSALGAQVTQSLSGREISVLGLMKGSLVFMSDLIRKIPLDLTVHLVRVTSTREQAAGRVQTEIVFSTAVPLEVHDGTVRYIQAVWSYSLLSSQNPPRIPRSRHSSGVLKRSSFWKCLFCSVECQAALGEKHLGGSPGL